MTCADAYPADRRASPLFDVDESPPPARATDLSVSPCPVSKARLLIRAWHSRLPHTQAGPWSLAFASTFAGTIFAVALWHNPSARTLPQDWLELRRMAVAPNAPHCTASHMLSRMARWIRVARPHITRLISYQDVQVHSGTIYRAAGWTPAWTTKPRSRDRSKPRAGTTRAYRSNINGPAPDGAGKVRWELVIRSQAVAS